MIPAPAIKIISQQVDKAILYIMNRQIPDSLNESYNASLSLEEVLAETQIDRQKSVIYSLTAPGEHPIWLNSALGEILCHVKVRPAAAPHAPLLLYQHGFAEIPYTSTWNRMIPNHKPFPAHSVCVQAPYHSTLSEPFGTGFSSVQHIYQMFAGSLRIMQLLQEQFEAEGAAFTVVSGLSWGGITSILYEGIFKQSRAAIPMFASPNLAQVLLDAAEKYNYTLPVPREKIDDLFNFTSYYERCDKTRIQPILGKDDLFFRYDSHAKLFPEETVLTLPSAHVGAMWHNNLQIRQRVLEVMVWAAQHPR